MTDEEIRAGIMTVRASVPEKLIIHVDGPLALFHLEMAYNYVWSGSEYPRILVSTPFMFSRMLSKIRLGDTGIRLPEQYGWIEGAPWFHGAKLWADNRWPLDEMFFVNTNKMNDPEFHSVVTGIRE